MPSISLGNNSVPLHQPLVALGTVWVSIVNMGCYCAKGGGRGVVSGFLHCAQTSGSLSDLKEDIEHHFEKLKNMGDRGGN